MKSPLFFSTAEEFRKWLQKNHQQEQELLVGFHKRKSGTPCMTWQESVIEAITYGWIDGVRKSIDENAYTIRFTPRKPSSIWSAINIKLAEELIRSGKMKAAGKAAFEKRKENRSKIYAYEKGYLSLSSEYLKRLKNSKIAWTNFQKMPTDYKKHAMNWVMNAKQEATREKRLNTLIMDSEAGRKVKPFSY
jgi:uncharacterized protein YdeI (YjbR/CyaY-like superfamily)